MRTFAVAAVVGLMLLGISVAVAASHMTSGSQHPGTVLSAALGSLPSPSSSPKSTKKQNDQDKEACASEANETAEQEAKETAEKKTNGTAEQEPKETGDQEGRDQKGAEKEDPDEADDCDTNQSNSAGQQHRTNQSQGASDERGGDREGTGRRSTD